MKCTQYIINVNKINKATLNTCCIF